MLYNVFNTIITIYMCIQYMHKIITIYAKYMNTNMIIYLIYVYTIYEYTIIIICVFSTCVCNIYACNYDYIYIFQYICIYDYKIVCIFMVHINVQMHTYAYICLHLCNTLYIFIFINSNCTSLDSYK